MTEHLIETFEDGVATLTMNRPEARNALTGEMGTALAAAVRRCSSRSSKVRADRADRRRRRVLRRRRREGLRGRQRPAASAGVGNPELLGPASSSGSPACAAAWRW